MINKIYKIINNKFSVFFNFVFFLRYLLGIFFISLVFFIYIPHFFDFDKRREIIKNHLTQFYGFDIKNMGSIEFYSLPVPNLKINNFNANFFSDEINLNTKKLTIYPELKSIFDQKNFHAKKIILDYNNLAVDTKDIKFLVKKIHSLKNKVKVINLNLKIIENKKTVIDLKKINYRNYGYNKEQIFGEVFGRKFIIKPEASYEIINFKLIDTGISATVIFSDKNQDKSYSGSIKSKILDTNLKLNFIYDNDKIKIKNFFLRDKKLSLLSEGIFYIRPYFKIDLNSEIKSIDINIIKNLNINNILSYKSLIKKINSKNDINFKSSKFSGNIIDTMNIKTNLAHGRLDILKTISISNTDFTCNSNINLFEEFPVIDFNCKISSPNKKDLLKKLRINYKKKDTLSLIVQGNLNIINNKINFDYIEANGRYKASREDLKYYKITFEQILFDEDFLNIFKMSKIQKFVSEIL